MKSPLLIVALMMSVGSAWAEDQAPEKIDDIGIDALLPEIVVVEQEALKEPTPKRKTVKVKVVEEQVAPVAKPAEPASPAVAEAAPAATVETVAPVRKAHRVRRTSARAATSGRRPASILPWPGTVKSAVREYVVKAGDTLSTILYAFDIKPLYGDRGWVQHNMARNADISNWLRLKPGQKLSLEVPETVAAAVNPARLKPPGRLMAAKVKFAPRPDATRWSTPAESARTGAYVPTAPRRDVRPALRQRPTALRPPGRRLPSS